MQRSVLVKMWRNLETDDESDEFDEEVDRVLKSIGRDWTVTDYEFYDKDDSLPRWYV